MWNYGKIDHWDDVSMHSKASFTILKIFLGIFEVFQFFKSLFPAASKFQSTLLILCKTLNLFLDYFLGFFERTIRLRLPDLYQLVIPNLGAFTLLNMRGLGTNHSFPPPAEMSNKMQLSLTSNCKKCFYFVKYVKTDKINDELFVWAESSWCLISLFWVAEKHPITSDWQHIKICFSFKLHPFLLLL